jgi:hypothetical protein
MAASPRGLVAALAGDRDAPLGEYPRKRAADGRLAEEAGKAADDRRFERLDQRIA